jgi:hypothetical protein
MKVKSLPHYYSFGELAEMLSCSSDHLRHLLARNHLRPSCWVWRERWPEPRFPELSISEWMRALDEFPPGCFEGPPPKLERPGQAFRESRRGATPGEIEAFLKCFSPKERERLRAAK